MFKYYLETLSSMGRCSSVGIATCYGLDGPGIESRWGRDFPHPSRPAVGPHSLLYNGYLVFPRGKADGAWRWPPTPSSAEVKERVELYFTPLPLDLRGLFWGVLYLYLTFSILEIRTYWIVHLTRMTPLSNLRFHHVTSEC
jgi:hypothetical protein